jgi:signal peptidase II
MRRAATLLVIAGGVLALDQWTKHLATAWLAGRPPVHLIGDLLQLTYALNSGVAFSLGAGTRFPFYLFSIAAAVVILWLFARGRVPGIPQQIALSLVLGGALGNLVDRISTGLVVDFIEMGVGRFRWPVFNVADSAVSVGVVLFILTGSTLGGRRGAAGAAAGAGGEAPAAPEAAASAPGPRESDDVAHTRAAGDAGAGEPAPRSLSGDGAGRPLA